MEKTKKSAEVAAKAVENEVINTEAQADAQTEAQTEAQADAQAVVAAVEKAAQGAKKMTDEDATALVDQLKETALNHRCLVVPFNTAEWVPGTIVGIQRDHRNSVAYAVKLDDGRRVLKQHTSKLIKISEETVAATVKTRIVGEKLTEEELDELYLEMSTHVGQLGESEGVHFRVIGVLRENRSRRCYYKVQYTESSRFGYKSKNNCTLHDFDDEGRELQAKFAARVGNTLISDDERLRRAEDNVKKAEAALEAATKRLEERKHALEEIKAKIAAKGAEAPKAAEPAETPANDDEDLL